MVVDDRRDILGEGRGVWLRRLPGGLDALRRIGGWGGRDGECSAEEKKQADGSE
mgnify:CR=1 FL=1